MGFNLNLLLIIPMMTLAGILITKDSGKARVVAAIGMSVQLLLVMWLWVAFAAERNSGNEAEVLFLQDYIWFKSLNIHYAIGVDGISVGMIVLTGVIIFTGVFASWTLKELPKEFFMWLILLSTGVFGFFISLDMFTLFLFFEIAVIPMYLLIGIWGTGRKEYAAMKLTLMLMGASAILIVGILGIYFNSSPDGNWTFNILEISKTTIPLEAQMYFFPFIFIGFGVISALFPFHTWSPDGHASAPTAVSMLHAGVLMKLGGYGILKVGIYLLPEAATAMADFFLLFVGIGVIYGALSAVMQNDLKYINAYSSVSHVGLILFGLLMLTKTALTGAVLQMISHGLITALFFGLIGMIYSRTHTRIVGEMRGLLKVMPFLSAAYVIAGLASLGLPGFSGFVAEITIFIGAFVHVETYYRVFTVIAVASIVVAAVYILRVIGKMLMGELKDETYKQLTDASWHEKVVVVTLILCITAIGMAPFALTELIRSSLEPIMMRF